MSTLDTLFATIEARRGADPTSSWTAKQFSKGPEKCAEKFGEEAVEAIIEAVRDDKAKLTEEAADVLYHLLVMLAARDVQLANVMAVLDARMNRSGLDERPRESDRLFKGDRSTVGRSEYRRAVSENLQGGMSFIAQIRRGGQRVTSARSLWCIGRPTPKITRTETTGTLAHAAGL